MGSRRKLTNIACMFPGSRFLQRERERFTSILSAMVVEAFLVALSASFDTYGSGRFAGRRSRIASTSIAFDTSATVVPA